MSSTIKTTRTALLLGAYGQTNLGDDLLMFSYIQLLQARGYTRIIVNVSQAKYVPQPVLDTFPDIEIFETYGTSALALLRLLRTADSIVYGGGTVYKELYATTGRGRYSVITRVMAFNILAALLGKKVYGGQIGIGSIKTARGRLITRLALRWCRLTTFRDEKSYAYARDTLRLPKRKIARATDGLFLNPAWQQQWRRGTLQAPKKFDGKVVGINVLHDIPDWIDRKKYIASLRSFTRQLLDDGYYVIFLPFQTGFNEHDDLSFTRTAILPGLKGYENYAVAGDLDISTITYYLQHIDLLVGMRFHSLLLAAAAGTPFTALAYDTKCWRFITEEDYPYGLQLEDLTAETMLAAFRDLESNAADARTRLQRIRARNFKAAAAWLKSTSL